MAASDRNIVAALSYVLGFITGIVILLVEKDDKFIRFHAMQSITVTGSLFLLNIALGLILRPLGILDVLAGMLNILFWFLILLVIWLGSEIVIVDILVLTFQVMRIFNNIS